MEYSKLWSLLKDPIDSGGAGGSSASPGGGDLTEAAIQDALGPQHRATRGTAAAKAAQVYELSLNGRRLSGLGDSNGQIASPLTQLTSLRKLTLNNNCIAEIHTRTTLQGLTELRELQLDFNNISVLPTFGNPKLETLSAAHNKIATFPILALPKLTNLDLSVNRIGPGMGEESLQGLRLPLLSHLDLSNNLLTSLKPLSGLTRLVVLNVASNQLTSLAGIEGMTSLEELQASRNKLRYTAILQHSNPLRTAGKKLNTLDVSHNEISSLAFFPGGNTMGEVWSLNISHNQFHGSKGDASADADGSAAGAKGALTGPRGRSTTRASGKNGGSNIFSSDDIGDATYADDDTASTATKGSSSKATARSQSQVPRSVAGPPSAQRSSSVSGSGAPSSVASSAGIRSRRVESDADTTFLQRLAALFPKLEVLDVSHNSPDIAPSYNDLRHLARCAGLTELRAEGTLEVRKGSVERHLEAVRAVLPGLEVLDRHVLVRREMRDDPALLDVDDLEGGVAAHRPGTPPPPPAPQTPHSRPGSARPQSARPKSALQASKAVAEFGELRDEMQRFLLRAELAHQRCNRIVDHMQASVAWAYGGAAKPPEEPDLHDLDEDAWMRAREEAARAAAAELSDDDDDDGDETEDAKSQRSETLVIAQHGATPPQKPPRGRSDAASPQGKRVAARSASTSGDLVTASSAPTFGATSSGAASRNSRSTGSSGGGGGAAAVVPRSSSSSRGGGGSGASVSSLSATYESEAMKRVKAQPSTSFALDHAKFRREMQREADERRQKLLELARQPLPAPKPVKTLSSSQLLLQQSSSSAGTGGKVTAECGTSTTSPGKGAKVKVAGGAGGGEKVTTSTSTATSPAKDAAADQLDKYKVLPAAAGPSRPVPQLAIPSAAASNSTTTDANLQFGDVGPVDDDGEIGEAPRTAVEEEEEVAEAAAVRIDPSRTDVRAANAQVDPRDLWNALRPSSAGGGGGGASSSSKASSSVTKTAGGAQLIVGPSSLVCQSRPTSAGASASAAAAKAAKVELAKGLLKSAAWEHVAMRQHPENAAAAQPLDKELESARAIKAALAKESDRQGGESAEATPEVQQATYFVPQERSLHKANTKKKAGSSLNSRR